MSYRIPLTDVTLDKEEADAAARVIESGWVTMGRETALFEQEFADALGVPHAVAVTNGTVALHLAYGAAGLGEDDEYLIPALTFVATMNAGLYLRGRPVLVDCVSENDLTLSPDDLESKITEDTRLIVTMSYGGFCPDMPRIMEIAERRGIPVVEDACHAPLARLGGRAIGTFGRAGAFSFFGNKNMTVGEGGMIVCSDANVDAHLRNLRTHGMTSVTWDRHAGGKLDYDVTQLGYNYRIDEVRSTIGREQLKKLPGVNTRRAQVAAALREKLGYAAIPGLQVPFEGAPGDPAHHLFVVLLPPGVDRTGFRLQMKEAGIQTSFHYPPLHHLSFTSGFWGFGVPSLPVLDGLIGRLVTLPLGPHLGDEQLDEIVHAMMMILKP